MPGQAYQLWLAQRRRVDAVDEQFWPNDGVLLREIVVDVARYDAIWITEETIGSVPSEPSTEGRTWQALLPAAA